MVKIFAILLGIIGVLLISGCTTTMDPSAIAKATGSVKEFLDEYPNAKVTASLFDESIIESIIDELRDDCGEQMKLVAYWKVLVKDPDSESNITVWIDEASMKAVCVIREGQDTTVLDTGSEDEDSSGGSDGTGGIIEGYCLGAEAIIQGAVYDSDTDTLSLYVNNWGDVDLSFDVYLAFRSGRLFKYSGYHASAGEVSIFTIQNVPGDLEEAEIKSNQCKDVQDFVGESGINGLSENNDYLSIAERGVNFLNEYFVEGGGVSLKNFEKEGDLLKITTEYDNQEIPIYMTFDGETIIIGGVGAVNIDEFIAAQAEDSADVPDEPADTSIPKSDRPKVEIFVMSYCPFGLQMQKAAIPVMELLGDKADIEIKFVHYIMHGLKEIEENNNQYCIQQEQPEKFLDYLTCFVQSDDHEKCATDAGVDTTKMDSCIERLDTEFHITGLYEDKSTWSNDRYPPYMVDAEAASQYGVRGSPTVVINGQIASVARSPEAVKDAICNAFNKPPEECQTELSSAQEASGIGPIIGLEPIQPVVCGDGKCELNEDCMIDCSYEDFHTYLECTTAAGGFFNAIIDVGSFEDNIDGLSVEEINNIFSCRDSPKTNPCYVNIDDISIEVGEYDVSSNWVLANTRVAWDLQKHIVGPGSWELAGGEYTNEPRHLFLYLRFKKETHPTNKKCWIGNTYLETATENIKDFYKCCYDYDNNEKHARIFIKIPETNKYILSETLLWNHRISPQPGPSLPEYNEDIEENQIVNLFVMSYCPFGLQMEKAMIPVMELLGDKVEFNIDYVQYIMHGKKEIDQNTIQHCIEKEQHDRFIQYLTCFVQSDEHEQCMALTGIDSDKLDDCIEATDEEYDITELYNDESTWSNGRYPPYMVDAELAEDYDIRGSPTFVLNGETISVDRSPEAVKQVICDAFDTPPNECDQELSDIREESGIGPIQGIQ